MGKGDSIIGDLIVFMIQKYGWGVISIGILGYFLIEMSLDVAGDLVSEWLRDKIDVRAGRKPR